MTALKLLPEEQSRVAQYIHSLTAISLDSSKHYLMEGRLGPVAEESGCRSFGDLISAAQADASGAIRRRIIDAITTGETSFFRDTSPFDLLRHKLLPELLDRRSRSGSARPIRIWSAACSTGQEIYSVAIVLKEVLGDPDRYGVRLLGTDISDEAVARASRGIYNAIEMGRGLAGEATSRYFLRSGDTWKIRDDLRAMASFRRWNLKEDFGPLGRFDIVFCRNVAIYFNDQDRGSLFDRIGRTIEPGGALVIGAMETLGPATAHFEVHRHLRAIYFTPK